MSELECGNKTEYCGEVLVCKSNNCRNYHDAFSMRYGSISWSDYIRPMPSKMYHSGGPGIRYGSYEADCQVMAAATMQDAVNRLEFLMLKHGLKVP